MHLHVKTHVLAYKHVFLKAEQEVAHIERHTYCALAVGQRSSPWQQESGAAAWSLWLTQVCEQITSACTYTHINAYEMHIHKYTSFMRGINSQLQHQLPVSEQQKPFLKCFFVCFILSYNQVATPWAEK